MTAFEQQMKQEFLTPKKIECSYDLKKAQEKSLNPVYKKKQSLTKWERENRSPIVKERIKNRASCNGCKYHKAFPYTGTYGLKCCHYSWDTGKLRGCPAENCDKKASK